MNDLTFTNLCRINLARCEAVFHRIDAWSLCDWATAMAGECGEACNVIKKIRRLQGADSPLDNAATRAALKEALGKELADVVIYCDLLATAAGMDLGEEVTKKFNEVSVRRNCLAQFSL